MPGAEARLQLDFAEQFRNSELSRCGPWTSPNPKPWTLDFHHVERLTSASFAEDSAHKPVQPLPCAHRSITAVVVTARGQCPKSRQQKRLSVICT